MVRPSHAFVAKNPTAIVLALEVSCRKKTPPPKSTLLLALRVSRESSRPLLRPRLPYYKYLRSARALDVTRIIQPASQPARTSQNQPDQPASQPAPRQTPKRYYISRKVVEDSEGPALNLSRDQEVTQNAPFR